MMGRRQPKGIREQGTSTMRATATVTSRSVRAGVNSRMVFTAAQAAQEIEQQQQQHDFRHVNNRSWRGHATTVQLPGSEMTLGVGAWTHRKWTPWQRTYFDGVQPAQRAGQLVRVLVIGAEYSVSATRTACLRRQSRSGTRARGRNVL